MQNFKDWLRAYKPGDVHPGPLKEAFEAGQRYGTPDQEPSYIVRAIAKPNQPLENKHLEILVQLGDQTYYLGASVLKLEAKPGEKITMFVELDVNELQIDAPATLIDEQGNRTTQRIKIQGSEPAGHALSSSTLDVEEVEGQKDLYIKDITLTANGHTAGNNLEAHTLRKIKD